MLSLPLSCVSDCFSWYATPVTTSPNDGFNVAAARQWSEHKTRLTSLEMPRKLMRHVNYIQDREHMREFEFELTLDIFAEPNIGLHLLNRKLNQFNTRLLRSIFVPWIVKPASVSAHTIPTIQQSELSVAIAVQDQTTEKSMALNIAAYEDGICK